MKNQSLILVGALLLGTASLSAQSVEVVDPGPFDGGRLRTNAAIDFHAFNQWVTPNENPGNVGWNPNGIWYSFLRFPTVSAEGAPGNPELFNSISSASSVTLDIGVLWNEIDAALVGTIAPGVNVSIYLVPGMDIPEGELPTWTNTWLGNFPDAIKFGEIIAGEAPTTSDSWQDSQDNPPTLEEREAARVSYDMTAAIASAVSDGLLTSATPWGIVFYTEEAEPLTPNDPQWVDRRGTVMDLATAVLSITSGGDTGATWGGYDVDANGDANTLDWMGWVNVTAAPWIYSYSLGSYVFMPEPSAEAAGAWGYVLK